MHVPFAETRINEIENRLKRGLPVNATALAEEFLVSGDAVRRDLRALAAEGKMQASLWRRNPSFASRRPT